MRYKAVAFDYDGTLADEGIVKPPVIECLRRLKESGRKLVLISGRTLDDIRRVFPESHELFDWVVGENGAVLLDPQTNTEKLLTQPADRLLIEELAERGVSPLNVGRCIIATYTEHEEVLSEVIKELSLDYSIIFNKEHAMMLPMSVNKASGLTAALKELHISLEHTVAFGDAENDEAMLAASAFGVAMQNSTPTLKIIASMVASGCQGDGVIEGVNHLLKNEFAGH